MKIKSRQTCIRTVRKGDKMWLIEDGFVVSPRAGFEFSETVPPEYRNIILQALDYGYLKPVAYMKDSELMWEILNKENVE